MSTAVNVKASLIITGDIMPSSTDPTLLESIGDSSSSSEEYQEVTHEQHMEKIVSASSGLSSTAVAPHSSTRNASSQSRIDSSNSNNNNIVAQISSFVRNAATIGPRRQNSDSHASSDALSLCSDNATIDGMQSIANFTVASCDTVKASNRTAREAAAAAAGKSKPPTSSRTWSKFKKAVGNVASGIPLQTNKEDKDGGSSNLGTDNSNPNHNTTGSMTRRMSNRSNSDGGNVGTEAAGRPSSERPRGADVANQDNVAGAVGGLIQKLKARPTGSAATSPSTSPDSTPPNSSRGMVKTIIDDKEMKKKLDQSMRARMDGLDALNLGPARLMSLEPESEVETEYLGSTLRRPKSSSSVSSSASQSSSKSRSKDAQSTAKSLPTKPKSETLPWGELSWTFTGRPIAVTPAEMVSNSLWMTCDPSNTPLPVIILEGFVPGSDDRWRVPVEEIQTSSQQRHRSLTRRPSHNAQISKDCACGQISLARSKSSSIGSTSAGTSPPSLAPAESHEECSDDGGSPVIPTHRLWSTLWGSQHKLPSHSNTIAPDLESMEDDDPLLHLAAEHSIPIDLDENTFCISERAHMQTIHNFVGVSLAAGRFSTAIFIFTKLLKGIEASDESLRFLKGSALHNIGILYLWQGEFQLAVENFHLAIQERTRSLPRGHPDIAVSMVRKGMAQFALGLFDDALFAMELAMETIRDDIARAKVVNNMGVILYQQKKFDLALKRFTEALEIQRSWLEGSLRREAIVYDAATTLSNMGKLYLEEADYNAAYYVYEEALLLQTTIFRKDHELVLASLQSLAITRVLDSQIKKALQILQGCLRSQNTRFGKESRESIETIALMGYLYERLDCREDSLKCFMTVRKWQKFNLHSDHPSVQKIKEKINKSEEALGRKVSVWV